MLSEQRSTLSRTNLTNNSREQLYKTKNLTEESMLFPIICKEIAKLIMIESTNSPTTLMLLKVNSTQNKTNSIELELKAIYNLSNNTERMKS